MIMHSHRNPTRRNRNIGTAKQGHGQNNALVIPSRSDGLYWLDRISDHRVEDRVIADRKVRFIIETNTLDCFHPCTVYDVLRVLEALPQSDWAGLQTFVFRQPTRKQLILSPVWGRLLYYSEITTAKGRPLAKGPAIFLDAIQVGKPLIWSTSLDQDDSLELDRLRADGHDVQRLGRKFSISVTASSARNTQLHRTFLHEIGHWFDWLTKVEEPAAKGGVWENLERDYFARPKAEREAFAHRYADAQRMLLEEKGIIPFDQIK
ncbi:hypothetical protein H0274_07325 [Altererythrobacter sp. CC-YST694]|uniref:hypothetical protein n=1 Tax=Altererythrobacter sp. CC-YST694 TaxID=2755038 RepID=UPI001D01F694|nr:hypothetical protein [Altererythrobacter sp. CC-YST694]MCB5425061.1 hypothetical protein [Altererythrobacter sp. CC-YST694]